MRDEIDGRLWLAHHEDFTATAERALLALRVGLGKLAGWDGSSHQLLAIAAAFAVTALTFNTTTA